ncbi:MAG: PQQ-dependent sugar dehydrogenase [Ferruginibacter sp.]
MLNLYVSFKKIFTLLPALFISQFIFAQPPIITYTSVVAGLTVPINVTNAGDGSNRLFIPQQNGKIWVRNGATMKQFADFGTTTSGGANIILYGGERGLLSIAFHPQYDGVTNRYFFIYHNDVNGDVAISRCQTKVGNPDTAEIGSIINIITIPHPTNTNHNGGQLRFGPDGYLYFATGDGGGGNDVPNNAQSGTVLLGKMIRIDIDNTSAFGNYAVPADNPYVDNAAIDDRIWALGLRNPYRWSFDRLTGDMWIGDVGQSHREEIDFRPAGATGHVNYGWHCYEGYTPTPGVTPCNPGADYVPPVFDYPNPDSGQAVTGGFVYRGSEYPALYGRYVAADVYTGYTWILSPRSGGGFDSVTQVPNVSTIVAFGEGEDGTIYAVSQGTNTLYKMVAIGGVVLPVKLTVFSGIANNGYNQLQWRTASEINTARFNVEYSKDGSYFSRAGTVAANRDVSGSNYNFRHYINNKGDVFYRLSIEDDNGTVSYTSIIKLKGTDKNNIQVYPTLVTNGIVNLDLNGKSLNTVRIINTTGMTVLKKDISNTSNTVIIPVHTLPKGIYIVEMEGAGILQTEKIFIK